MLRHSLAITRGWRLYDAMISCVFMCAFVKLKSWMSWQVSNDKAIFPFWGQQQDGGDGEDLSGKKLEEQLRHRCRNRVEDPAENNDSF